MNTPEKNPAIQFHVSLRDWFAGQMAAAIFSESIQNARAGAPIQTFQQIASDAFNLADALLAASTQQPEPAPEAKPL